MSVHRAEAPRAELVQRALASCGRAVLRRGAASWRLVLANGKPFAATAALEEGWLVLAAPRPDLAPGCELLAGLAAAPPAVKVVLAAGERHAELRSELPLEDERPLPAVVAAACAALCAGMSADLAAPAPARRRRGQRGAAGGTGTDLLAPWREAVAAAGLASAPQASFWIAARGERWPARLVEGHGGVLARLTLAELPSPAAPTRSALALLLLRGALLLRGVRTALVTTGEDLAAVADWPLLQDEPGAALAEASEALAAAALALGPEARVLRDPAVARAYLAARPASPTLTASTMPSTHA